MLFVVRCVLFIGWRLLVVCLLIVARVLVFRCSLFGVYCILCVDCFLLFGCLVDCCLLHCCSVVVLFVVCNVPSACCLLSVIRYVLFGVC